ncbi:flagellar hook capping FlgD N-terminal domain-containing protein [Noviherbaspirillum galbum]|uniref:Basal-body rod modification protein FlgD n=1 Tax=Noviherbaspirillum galbum TaxID=2709383 RepID=A0A6B3SQW2_9BURK|nr:flagellar hook capping FlgD N-terminal domain-containing protein [Noviherbaspirillum galbum]NEX63031.1 flagellar hook capping protein [Noviherbaspirillum galbum]
MAIESIAAADAQSKLNSIGIQEFLKILTSQLTNQDPLKPLDNQEFIAQVAQFTSLEQSRQLNQKIDQLVAMQAASHSIGMLGRVADIKTDSGTQTGTVKAIGFQNGEARLTLQMPDGSYLTDVAINQINTIR